MTGREGEPPAAPHLTLKPVTAARGEQNLARLAEAEPGRLGVARLLDQDTPVWDKRVHAYRTIRPGDIAVLLRRFTNVHIFEQALEAYGIRMPPPSGTGFYSRAEVVDLGNLLRWLAEPDDDIALIAVLRSPMFVLADDTLLALRGNGTRRPLLPALGDPPPGLDRTRPRAAPSPPRCCATCAAPSRTASAADPRGDRTRTLRVRGVVGADQRRRAGAREHPQTRQDPARLAAYSMSAVVELPRSAARRSDRPRGARRPGPAARGTDHDGARRKGAGVPGGCSCPKATSAHSRERGDPLAARHGLLLHTRRDDDDRRPQPGFHALIRSRDSASEDQEPPASLLRGGDPCRRLPVHQSGDETTRGWLAPGAGGSEPGAPRRRRMSGQP